MRVVKGDVTAVEARRRLLLSTILSLFGLLLAIGPSPAVAAPPAEYNQTYRPQFHYSPQQNWMNDPNGLVCQGRLPPLLPVQPAGQPVGQHELGPRHVEGPGALGGAACRHPTDLQRRGSVD